MSEPLNREYVAAMSSLDYARDFMEGCGSDFDKSDWPHLCEMAEKLLEMPESEILKRNRYLGWIQACICIAAVGVEGDKTPYDAFNAMIEINRTIYR